MTNLNSPLAKAIRKAGGQMAFAKLCGHVPSTIFRWFHMGIVPAKQVIRIEKLTGISRYELNPEAYPRDENLD